MFKVNFYQFAKRENSTKRPTGEGLSFDCILKEPSGILAPSISLNLGLTQNPSIYNYCYIPIFERYYYITEWYYQDALWQANLKVDTLATAKDYIGNKDLYILRSSNEFDTYVSDSIYATKTNVSSDIKYISSVSVWNEATDRTTIVNDYFAKTQYSDGMYYLGVMSAEGVKYYAFGYTAFNRLLSQLFGYVPSDYTDVSPGLAKKIANPIEYITTCYWLPYAVPGLDYSIPIQIKFGEWTFSTNGGAREVLPRIDNCQSYVDLALPKHPLSARGKYFNTPPYTDYQLVIEPFGTIAIDASALVDVETLHIEWYTDIATGIANLYVFGANKLVASASAQLGVAIPLTQVNYDYIGSQFAKIANRGKTEGNNTLMGALSNLNSALVEGASGMLSTLTGGIVGNVENSIRSQTQGTMGNFLAFNSRLPALYTIFYDVVDEYNEELGRPLCKIRKPANLGGYMVALDGSLEAPYTQTELADINTYLRSGFFYE